MNLVIKGRSNSIINLNEREILTRIRIINSFKLNEEAFLKKYFCDRDSLFNICLPSFKKLVKEKPDIKFISLYLSNLKKFINLLKNINEDNSNNTTQKQNLNQKDKFIKLIKYVSENITYEHFSAKRLVMRYGEPGSKFYIILNGFVSILIPVKVNIHLNFYEYNKYIATLLYYQEFELAKITLRENKHIYRMDLPDIKYFIKYIKKAKEDSEDNNNENSNNISKFNPLRSIKSEKSIHNLRMGSKISISKYFKDKIPEDNDSDDDYNEYSEKIEKFFKMFLTKEQFKKLEEIKSQKQHIVYLERDDGNEITVENYINRIKSYKNNNNNLNENNKINNTNNERIIRRNQTRRQIRSKTYKIFNLESLNENGQLFGHNQELNFMNQNRNSLYTNIKK